MLLENNEKVKKKHLRTNRKNISSKKGTIDNRK